MMKNNILYTAPAAQDTVAAVMSREPLVLSPRMTAREALARLRQVGIPQDFLTNCYVVDEEGLLLGLLTVRTLLTLPERTRLDQAAEAPKAVLAPQEDQERAAALLDQLEVSELPVADGAGRLVGTFTAEDALGVLKEEATEDIELMAAILPSDKPYLKTGVFETWKARTPWLLVLMLSATFTGIILTHFENALSACAVLTAFIPMLSGTGGNSGTQASTAVIRALSLGEVRFSDLMRVLWKEFRVSLCCGICLAAANFVKMMLVDRILMNNPAVTPWVALVVCCTLVGTVLCAKLVGCSLPILAEKIGFDPAVMASPFISTIVDSISLLIYFRFATLILGI